MLFCHLNTFFIGSKSYHSLTRYGILVLSCLHGPNAFPVVKVSWNTNMQTLDDHHKIISRRYYVLSLDDHLIIIQSSSDENQMMKLKWRDQHKWPSRDHHMIIRPYSNYQNIIKCIMIFPDHVIVIWGWSDNHLKIIWGHQLIFRLI